VVIENGILKSYLLNTYTAKSWAWRHRQRLSRTRWTPGIGRELFSGAGTKSPKQIIAAIKSPLIVEFLVHGANLVTATTPWSVWHVIVNGDWRIRRRDHSGRELKEMFCIFPRLAAIWIPGRSVARDNSHGWTYDRRRVAEHCGINLFVTFPVSFALTFHACRLR